MSLYNRLNRIEQKVNEKEVSFPVIPDIKRLNDNIASTLNEFHLSQGEKIDSFQKAKETVDKLLSKKVINESEHKIMIKSENKFWQKADESDNPIFFME